MQLIIDDREDSNRIQTIKDNFQSEVIVRRLDAGDILIEQDNNHNILIEVKTIQDFIGSCNNRRMQKEALQMKEACDFCYILIYDDGKWNKKYVNQSIDNKYGNIVSLTQRYKIPVVQCDNTLHFIKAIKAIIRNVNRTDEPIEPPNVRDKDTNDMINVLIGIPKVGKKMARTLLDEFGSPGAVFCATDEELDSIPRLQTKSKSAIKRMR